MGASPDLSALLPLTLEAMPRYVVERNFPGCICEGPTPEAIRRVVSLSGLPVDLIYEVRVLDPYFYLGAAD